MTQPPFPPFAALILADGATTDDTVRIAESAAALCALGANPLVVAVPPGIAPLTDGARMVRTSPGAPPIAAIRLGMAQLTNTSVSAVLFVPLAAIPVSGPSLDAMLERWTRSPGSIVAFQGAALDDSPLVIPRTAWLQLMTIGEHGVQAVVDRVGLG